MTEEERTAVLRRLQKMKDKELSDYILQLKEIHDIGQLELEVREHNKKAKEAV